MMVGRNSGNGDAAREEQGFTVVEVMVAITIMLVSILTMAYTASIGFRATVDARRTEGSTQAANRVLEEMSAIDRTELLLGLNPSDTTIDADPHIDSGSCTNGATGIEIDCDGEEILFDAAATALDPHTISYTVGTTDYTISRYVTWVDGVGGDLLRLTVLVSYEDGSAGTRSDSYSRIYETVSSSAIGATTVEYVDGAGSVTNGIITLSGVLSSGSFTSARIGLPTLNASVVSNPSVNVVSSRNTLLASMTNGATTVNCGGKGASASASEAAPASTAPSALDDQYCIDATASGAKVARPTSTITTKTYLEVVKRWTDAPATAAVAAFTDPPAADTTCDTTSDDVPCAAAKDEPMGGGATAADRWAVANLRLWSANNVTDRGTCPVVRVFTPVAGQSMSSVIVDRDHPDESTNKVTVTVTRKLPVIALGCFPTGGTAWAPTTYSYNGTPGTWSTLKSVWDNPPALTGWTGGGFLIRLRGVVETLTVEAGTGASNPTYTRTGTVDYWNGTAYAPPVAISEAATTITLPALKWSTSSPAMSMCQGSSLAPVPTGSAPPTAGQSFTIPAGSAPTPGTSNPIESATATNLASMLPANVYFHTSNSATNCTLGTGNNPIAQINIAPDTGDINASASYAAVTVYP